MQRHDQQADLPDTNFDLLNENRGAEPTDGERDVEDGPVDRDPRDSDELVAGRTSGGQPMAVVLEEDDDGATTGPNDRDQADDAALERERAR
jgi:hypothetical protein